MFNWMGVLENISNVHCNMLSALLMYYPLLLSPPSRLPCNSVKTSSLQTPSLSECMTIAMT